MDNLIRLIPLDKIKPEFDFKITDTYFERMKKSEDHTIFNLLLAVISKGASSLSQHNSNEMLYDYRKQK